jgi:hypothetical protein
MHAMIAPFFRARFCGCINGQGGEFETFELYEECASGPHYHTTSFIQNSRTQTRKVKVCGNASELSALSTCMCIFGKLNL